jgi:hypothetical protein
VRWLDAALAYGLFYFSDGVMTAVTNAKEQRHAKRHRAAALQNAHTPKQEIGQGE